MTLTYVKAETGRIYEVEARATFIKGEILPAAQGKRLFQEQAQESLREILKHGDTVYCVLRSVSSSGMSRNIDFYAIKNDQPIWLSGYICAAMDWKRGKDRGITIKGCGMDMGFHAVYCLASMLWPKGNPNRDDKDGGYLLKSAWM